MDQARYIAFSGTRRIGEGELAPVVAQTKAVIDAGTPAPVLIFHDATSAQLEVDFRGTVDEVLAKLAARIGAAASPETPPEPSPESPSGPGRPKLGVVAREVTLLPRHWAWLNSQPGGASVALRKLVDQARRTHERADRLRQAQEAAYKFMQVMAGDNPGFEEAIRALYAHNAERFHAEIADWPADVRAHAARLAARVFQAEGE